MYMGYEFNSPVKLQSDNYRLRMRVEELESGEAILRLQKQHEKELRSRDFANKKLEKEIERYRNLWQNSLKEIDHLRDMIFDVEENLRVAKDDQDAGLKREYQLQEQLKELQGIILKLKAQMNRDYENSSIPSSQKQNHKKIRNSRVKTEREPGGQPGHQGHGRKKQQPTTIKEIPVTEEIKNNPDLYPTGNIIKKQVIDISFTITVTEYQTPEYRNRKTGTRIHASFPEGI